MFYSDETAKTKKAFTIKLGLMALFSPQHLEVEAGRALEFEARSASVT